MGFTALYRDGAHGTYRAKIFAFSAADALLFCYHRTAGAAFLCFYHHNGADGAVACAVAAAGFSEG